MKKIYDVFNQMSKEDKIGHAFLIGNVCYEECKADLEKSISKFIFKNGIKLENNPDVYLVEPITNSVSKDQIRELLFNLSTSSQINGKKVYIITNCENLSDNVYNSLLKTIEEPSDNVYAFLITSNMEQIGDTIKSRCQKIFVSSDSLIIEDDGYRDRALSILKKIELNGLKTIAINNEIYSSIEDRNVLKSLLIEMYMIYMKSLHEMSLNNNEKNFICKNNTALSISKKILVINKIIEKTNTNINKDTMIDKLIIDIWRCNNEDRSS